MVIWKSALLGLVQGLTEFLPVSSSGHLVLLKYYLNTDLEGGVSFEVVVHAGTLFATIIIYRRILWDLIRYFFKEAPNRLKSEGFTPVFWGDEKGRLISLLLLGTIPTLVIGFVFKDLFENLFGNVLAVTIFIGITGTVLYSTGFVPGFLKGKRRNNIRSAIIIGVVQGLAITPGISRSGTTISAGMWMGIHRKKAADYSFLLSIPAITGAFVFNLRDMTQVGNHHWLPLGVGFVVSFISGYVALKFLLDFVHRGKFHVFAWYCWGIALLSLAGYILHFPK